MDVIFVAGRVLYSLVFIRSGLSHFRSAEAMQGAAKSKGIPLPQVTVPLGGAMIVAGGIMVALGLWADLGALLIAAFLVPTALIMHAYWKIEDPQESFMDSIHFFKDVGLLGAALVTFYLYNQVQDVPASLTDALFGRF